MASAAGARGRIGVWLAGIGVAALFAWLGWYGYEDRRTTTRSLHVIGLLRDVQTCVGLSYEANLRDPAFGAGLDRIVHMRSTRSAADLAWDPARLRATATFADVHRDYDGRALWTEARRDAKGDLHWTCGSTVAPGARAWRMVAEFIERCDRPLAFDDGMVQYCAKYVPLPPAQKK